MSIGVPLLTFDSLESTNKTAAELLAMSKVGHGAAILAHVQTDGRGQRGSSWASAPGKDVAVSIVLKPTGLRADNQFALGKVAALAVSDVVRMHVQADVRVKWPNDVLVERRKIAGILIKNEVIGELVVSSIVGIGINVNGTDLPPDLVATSLAVECGREFDLTLVVEQLFERFAHWWGKWSDAPEDGLMSYSDRLWTRGRWADMVLDGTPISARTMDVDPTGRLIVEHEDGRVAAYGLDRLRFAAR